MNAGYFQTKKKNVFVQLSTVSFDFLCFAFFMLFSRSFIFIFTKKFQVLSKKPFWYDELSEYSKYYQKYSRIVVINMQMRIYVLNSYEAH